MLLFLMLLVVPPQAGAQEQHRAAVASFRDGLAAQQRGAWDEAARAYERAIAAEPQFAEAHANLGAVLMRLGRQAEAVAEYERALSIAPDLQAARINLGLAHFRAGAVRDAVRVFDAALARDPSSVQARQLLGLSLVEAGRHADAIPYLEAVRAISPDDPSVLFALGRAYAAAGDARAEEIRARLMQLPAAQPLYLHLQGLLLQRQGRHREALSAFDAARAANTELPGVSLAIGISRLALGEDDLAETAFEEARARAPRDGVPLFYLAWMHDRAGRLGPARRRVEEALSADPDLVEARALFGKVLPAEGAFTDAARHLALAAQREPEDPSIRYLLAQAYQRAGDTAAALREFDEARRLKAMQIARERRE